MDLMAVGVGSMPSQAVSTLGGLYSGGTGADINNFRRSSSFFDAPAENVATVGDKAQAQTDDWAADWKNGVNLYADLDLWNNSVQPAPKGGGLMMGLGHYGFDAAGEDVVEVTGGASDAYGYDVAEIPGGASDAYGNDVAEIPSGGSDAAGKESAEFDAAPDRSLSLGSQNGSSTGQAVGASVAVTVGVGAVAAVAVTAGVGAAASAAAALAALVALIAAILFIATTLRKLAKYAAYFAIFFFVLFLCLTFVSLS